MGFERIRSVAMRAAGLPLALVIALVSAGAHAADSVEAEALIREGVALRRAGSDVRALPLFLKAYELAHTPRTAAQLGLVEFALGYSLDAENHLSEGLAVPTDSWIAKNRKTLDETLAGVKSTIGEVVVTGSPDGADVILNGRPAGRIPLPAPLRVGQGPALVELKADGYVSVSAPVLVVGGKSASINLHLHRPESAVAVLTAAPTPAAVHVDGSADKPST